MKKSNKRYVATWVDFIFKRGTSINADGFVLEHLLELINRHKTCYRYFGVKTLASRGNICNLPVSIIVIQFSKRKKKKLTIDKVYLTLESPNFSRIGRSRIGSINTIIKFFHFKIPLHTLFIPIFTHR